MPYQEVWVDPEIATQHNGVTVYHTYKNNEYNNGPSWYWFTTDESSDGEDEMDVRDLANWRMFSRSERTNSSDWKIDIKAEQNHIITILNEAIELGLIQ